MKNEKSITEVVPCEVVPPEQRPSIAHALLVEVFQDGKMRVRVDSVFIAERECKTLRPETGIEPVAREVGLDQAAQAAAEFVGMLRAVYPG